MFATGGGRETVVALRSLERGIGIQGGGSPAGSRVAWGVPLLNDTDVFPS